jgi:hypothetical protein
MASEVQILPSPLQLFWHRDRSIEDMKQRFDEVLRELEQERQQAVEQAAAAAAEPEVQQATPAE